MASYTPAFMEKVKANPDDYIQTPLQIIRKPRPSPRTIGTTVNPETGEVIKFQKFGAQQLEFVDPTKPSLGVREIIPKSVDPFGGLLKGVFGTKTVRDTAYPELSISGTVDKEPLIPRFFGAIDKHGCEEACKNGTISGVTHGILDVNCLLINMDANVKLARMELDNVQIRIQSVTHGILDAKFLRE
jgi:hypothetical protein